MTGTDGTKSPTKILVRDTALQHGFRASTLYGAGVHSFATNTEEILES